MLLTVVTSLFSSSSSYWNHVYHIYNDYMCYIGHYFVLYDIISFSFLGQFQASLDHFMVFLIISIMVSIILNSFGHFTSFHFYVLFISWPFLCVSVPFLGISEHFWYDVYCSEQFLGYFKSFHSLVFVSWLVWGIFSQFLGVSKHFWYNVYYSEHFSGHFT